MKRKSAARIATIDTKTITRKSTRQASENRIVSKYAEDYETSSTEKKSKVKSIKNEKITKQTSKKETEKRKKTNKNQVNLEMQFSNKHDEFFNAFEQEATYLCDLFESLIEKNQSNSILISGSAGVGKTTLVENCLSKFPVLSQSSETKTKQKLKAVIFRFDGVLHSKNEPALLRQMGKRLNTFFDKEEQIVLDDLDESFNEQDDEKVREELDIKLNNSIPKIMNLFKTLVDRVSNFRSVIILDQFEMFCSKQQHLLYNLFDLIQYGKGVLIIGITRVLESYQLLISRVQSRLNQRYIHLACPLNTIEKWRLFCEHQVRIYSKQNPEQFKNVFNNRDAFEIEVKRNFSMSRTFSDAKIFILQSSFMPKNNTSKPLNAIALNRDSKLVDLINISKNELVIILATNKRLKMLDQEQFNCNDLFQWTTSVGTMKNLKYDQLIKSVYIMIELDLIVYAKEIRSKTQSSLTPWTKLRLNISDVQLKEFTDNLSHKLPTYLKQLLN